MSHIALSGHASGTGTLTFAAPNTNTDRTLTLPDSAGTLATAESVAAAGYTTLAAVAAAGYTTLAAVAAAGYTTLAAVAAAGYTTSAGVLSQFNASGSAPVYACRAWVNFNGTGTVAIRASGNVSSITDNGTGDYTVNFTTAMSNTNYACVGMNGQITSGGTRNRIVTESYQYRTSASARFHTGQDATTILDADAVMITVFA